MPGIVPHTCNTRIWEAKAGIPRVRGPAWATQQDPILKIRNSYFIFCPKHRN